jgi:flagellin-like hook-associated protein FlgL
MSDISLTSSARSSLISLQQTADLSARTQSRLTSGKKVNTVLDNAVAFFQAQGLTNRATDLTQRKDTIDQGLSTLQSTLRGVQSVSNFLTSMKGLVQAAASQNNSQRAATTTSIREIGRQINQLLKDTSYNGLNILTSTAAKLSVQFSERTAAILNVRGFDLDSTSAAQARAMFTDAAAFNSQGSFLFSNIATYGAGLGSGLSHISGSTGSQASIAGSRFQAIISRLDRAITQIQNLGSQLGVQVSILQTRADFTTNYSNDLKTGSDKLTLADLNEEGANLVALNTRQSLSIQALSVAGQNQQAVLQLLR